MPVDGGRRSRSGLTLGLGSGFRGDLFGQFPTLDHVLTFVLGSTEVRIALIFASFHPMGSLTVKGHGAVVHKERVLHRMPESHEHPGKSLGKRVEGRTLRHDLLSLRYLLEVLRHGFREGFPGIQGFLLETLRLDLPDEFVELLKKSVLKKYVLGDPRIKENTLGPIIDDRTAGYVSELLEDAVNMGAKVVLGGKRVGRNMDATILTEVTKKMRLAWEEPFGPILPVMKVASWEEAVALANQSEYGLQSSVFTKDIDKAWAMAEALEVGSIQINGKDARGPDHFPFTGFKHSGIGMVQGAKYLIAEMTRYKTIVMNTKG